MHNDPCIYVQHRVEQSHIEFSQQILPENSCVLLRTDCERRQAHAVLGYNKQQQPLIAETRFTLTVIWNKDQNFAARLAFPRLPLLRLHLFGLGVVSSTP